MSILSKVITKLLNENYMLSVSSVDTIYPLNAKITELIYEENLMTIQIGKNEIDAKIFFLKLMFIWILSHTVLVM